MLDVKVLPCPSCGRDDIDPEEWLDDKGNSGPGCPQCDMWGSLEAWNRREDLSAFVLQHIQPIPMILHCPVCHEQHIDAPEPSKVVRDNAPFGEGKFKKTSEWNNPPHRSHLCHACGCIWRPADVATVGVAVIATYGKKDTWPAEY